LEEQHFLFISIDTGSVVCLPDDYEVDDESLNDIKHNLHPRYENKEIREIDEKALWVRSLEGSKFLPGYLPINDLKDTNYISVVL
jgi:U4/U6.U5 tri-snRNP-associated protein 2